VRGPCMSHGESSSGSENRTRDPEGLKRLVGTFRSPPSSCPYSPSYLEEGVFCEVH
jgi:hypothetical protein